MSEKHIKILFWEKAECDRCDKEHFCVHLDLFPNLKNSNIVIILCDMCLYDIINSMPKMELIKDPKPEGPPNEVIKENEISK